MDERGGRNVVEIQSVPVAAFSHVSRFTRHSLWPLADFFRILLEDSTITVPYLSRHIVELRQMQDRLGNFLS